MSSLTVEEFGYEVSSFSFSSSSSSSLVLCNMKCFFPRMIRNPRINPHLPLPVGESPYILVPCGKCHECLKARRRLWLFRLKQESLHSSVTYFTTFSFDDEKCKSRLLKSDLQNLFKRLRRRGLVFKYYAIGEFGSNFGREHYHVVFFLKQSVSFLDFSRILEDEWKYGFVKVGDANASRLNYILHYHIRPKENDKHPGEKGFQLFSKGLGLHFMTNDRLELIRKSSNNLVEDYEGFSINLPRYYRKKFDIPAKDIDFHIRQWNFLSDFARQNGYDEFEFVRECHKIDELRRISYNNENF